MQIKDLILGIDTSNYTTSLAIIDTKGIILIDSRVSLFVKHGERGLRQSKALFQHMENLPDMVLDLFRRINRERIAAVAVSNKPRPVEGSYMPVFKAGVTYGKVMAASLGVPFFEFSHQEGHLEAIRHDSCISNTSEFVAYHLSGGTTEILHIDKDTYRLIGGSRDLAFGQVLDRVGVALGFQFPSGSELDKIAVKRREIIKKLQLNNKTLNLKRIPIDGFEINLSGLETQCQREILRGAEPDMLIYELFSVIAECLCQLTDKVIAQTGCSNILYTGGVSASCFVRDQIERYFSGQPVRVIFGNPSLSSDNAVGIAYLGGKKLWQLNQ
ncbi:MAG: hypothetical protein ACOX4V_11300 [Anaerovoracaceae bacterium]|jgi:N6-L-threonylcarbamoyladenine synthase